MPLFVVTAAGALAGAVALCFAIPALIRRARLDRLATLAIAPEHVVDLPAGEVVVHLAGPLGKRGLGDLSFALVDGAGVAVPGSAIVVRSRRSAAGGGVLLAVRRFALAARGAYRFLVSGIPAERDLSDCRIVLARAQDAGLVASILAVVIAAATFVACSVLSAILWSSPAS